MKKVILSLMVSTIAYTNYAQNNVGINTVDPKTTLHVVGNPTDQNSLDGLLVPRLTGDQLKAKTYTSDQEGVMVYVTEAVSINNQNPQIANVKAKGHYIFNGIVWVASKDQEPWKVVGTSDSATKNIEDIYQNGKVGIGFSSSDNFTTLGTSQINALEVKGGDAVINGVSVGTGNSNKSSNLALGVEVLKANTTGINNTATGYQVLSNNTSGSSNTAIGTKSLLGNTTGSNNIGIGYSSSTFDNEGDNQLSIGNSIVGTGIGDTDYTNDKIGIGLVTAITNNELQGTAPTNTLHVKSTENPVRFEGLQLSTTNNDKVVLVNTDGVLKTIAREDLLEAGSQKVLQYVKNTTSPVDSDTPTNSITTLDNLSIRYNGTATGATNMQIRLNTNASHVTLWSERIGAGGTFGSPDYETLALNTGSWNDIDLTLNPNNRDMIRYTLNLHNTKETYRVSVLGNGNIAADGSVPAAVSSVTIFIEKLN